MGNSIPKKHNETTSTSANRFFDLLALLVQFATATVLTALVLLIAGEAFLRGFAKTSLGFAEEITGYFVAMLTFFGAALALRGGALYRVHFLFDRLPLRARLRLQTGFISIALAMCIVFAWNTNNLVLSSLARGRFAPTVLETPLWIPQILLPSGFVIIGIFLVEQLLLSIRAFKGRT